MKRISIKGKGVDAWFGEDSGRSAPPPSVKEDEVLASQPAHQLASEPAIQPASKQSSLPASKLATPATRAQSSEAPQQDEPAAPILGSRRRLRELVLREHPVAGTFRFTQDELDAIRDIRYELEVKRGVKVTGNDIIRLGLNSLIDDYRERGDSSLLLDVFKEEGRRSTG